ncbi:hypothetical protein DFP72DRAFT_1078030 [Ephemerocybe angulata]|uniref:Uncharacterized protein n=1 Tax=Ephemerocybe angulata TaxID=980116 RepID=A0A8H6LWL1_9AGAR|nr:hypothetical protein DFP72DRAFT_1078030 [Tulosesus angulatus]
MSITCCHLGHTNVEAETTCWSRSRRRLTSRLVLLLVDLSRTSSFVRRLGLEQDQELKLPKNHSRRHSRTPVRRFTSQTEGQLSNALSRKTTHGKPAALHVDVSLNECHEIWGTRLRPITDAVVARTTATMVPTSVTALNVVRRAASAAQ